MLAHFLALAVSLLPVHSRSIQQVALNAPPRPTRSQDGAGSTWYPRLEDATLSELTAGLESARFSSVDLVNAYLARIEETNGILHAVTEVNPDALAIAKSLDDARFRGKVLGPLHGLPVLLKDNIATDDRLNNTAGSYALLGATVPEDSTVAAKLRRAGAIILGKANMSQWAQARSLNDSSGWSAYGGQTYGAYYPLQDPSGSSSGSGVATSIGLAWATIGTETAGSIVFPAHANGVVGIKPTVGLTSRYLVVPISEHQDTVGPLARTVTDAAYLLQAIAGPDDKDNYTSAIPFRDGELPDYVAACKMSGLEGKRVGVSRALLGEHPREAVLAHFEAALEVLRSAGATIVDDIPLPGLQRLLDERLMVFGAWADMISDIAKYFSLLKDNPHNITTLAELRDFTRAHPLEGYPQYDTGVFDNALERGLNNTSPEYWALHARARYLSGPLGVTGAMENFSLDAIVTPTEHGSVMNAVLGLPAVGLPLGVYPPDTEIEHNEPRNNLVHVAPGMPFGITFLGGAFEEEKLIGMAYAFEQRTLAKPKPIVRPRTELEDVVLRRKTPRRPGILEL